MLYLIFSEEGGKKRCTGKNGEDLIIKVPEGTVIYVPDTGGDSEKTTINLYYDELYRQPKSITEKQVRETERREHEWNFSEQ